MKKIVIAGAALVVVLVFVLIVLFVGSRVNMREVQREARAAVAPSPGIQPAMPPSAMKTQPAAESHQGYLYGRITTVDGVAYEGLLRFGGNEEVSWGDYFNGAKGKNPWVGHAPKQRRPVEVFGVEIARQERPMEVQRLFMTRFGDIARIEAQGRDVRVTLKSGTAFDLNRFDASDFDDGVRVWDGKQGVVDLDSVRIRTIELVPTPPLGAAAYRLYGTVRTQHGDFTGFIQWNRQECIGTDTLSGRTAEGETTVRFDAIGSIARRVDGGSLVTLLDGPEIPFASSAERGIYVADPRYGRVLISWEAFQRVDFGPGGSGPAYGDFPPGSRLTGTITTRAGGRLTGRLVYDLDESESTETLDAPSQGVDYTIPFGLIASIVPENATVILRSGEELQLERRSDLGEGNAGILVFADGRAQPEYVPWADVARVDFD